jgi:ubiquinone/menaquinone biosynthesis C-methylase UbiE
MKNENVDRDVVEGFGREWQRYDQAEVDYEESRALFNEYFSIFPWSMVGAASKGMDVGCGSGRWARFVAPRVGELHCIDPSAAALEVAKENLRDLPGCSFHCASASNIPLRNDSLDFGYSLGVLHHVPDPAAALRDCVAKLKVGAPFLVYLYYALDNRPVWFKQLWRATDVVRRGVSALPFALKLRFTQAIATLVYWPLARLALLAEKCGFDVESMPLSTYRNLSFYTMRTDALDRFGTKLEQRFSAGEVKQLMEAAGLRDIRVSATKPYWCAVGLRA